MQHKYILGVAALMLVLTACGGGSSDSGDVPTLGITTSNALTIAGEVYRVSAVDVPHAAAVAMVPGSLTDSIRRPVLIRVP